MRKAGNQAWDARTRFSDDPFAPRDIPPYICDDLKVDIAGPQGIIGRTKFPSSESCAGSVDYPPAQQAESRDQRNRASPARQSLDGGLCIVMGQMPAGSPGFPFLKRQSIMPGRGVRSSRPFVSRLRRKVDHSRSPNHRNATCRQNSLAGRKGKRI